MLVKYSFWMLLVRPFLFLLVSSAAPGPFPGPVSVSSAQACVFRMPDAPWAWDYDHGNLMYIKWWVLNGYGSIPIDTFLVGWTSIYQLFWCSPGTRVLTHPQIIIWLGINLGLDSWMFSLWCVYPPDGHVNMEMRIPQWAPWIPISSCDLLRNSFLVAQEIGSVLYSMPFFWIISGKDDGINHALSKQ